MPPNEDLKVGDPAPRGILLPNQWGESVALENFRGLHQVVFFYPMDDTPGCTLEGREFRELHDQFEALGCVIIGVSTDSAESHREFAEKHGFPFILLADEEGRMAEAFGVLNGTAAERATFVLDREMRVRRIFRRVNPRRHAQEVLNFVRNLLESHRMLGG